ncbi:MAG: ABC transporter permease [Clostridia bacterium]|nr:ABC transporter permease [Clostridia bacterium]
MINEKKYSLDHIRFLRKERNETIFVYVLRFSLLALLLLVWEILAVNNVIDPFITSYPSKIFTTVIELFKHNDLLMHIGVTLYETFLGFIISVVAGFIIALIMWLSVRCRRVLEPYVVVLNSLPKIALGPIIIVWFGSGNKAIIAMAVLISVIVCIMTMLGGFLSTDKDKILLLKSFGANKWQIMTKLVIPSNLPTFVNMLKIALGMAWIGSIMGEYLVSKAGLGYLIVYGSQVFKLDLVMASTVVLLVLSALMYAFITLFEKLAITYKTDSN